MERRGSEERYLSWIGKYKRRWRNDPFQIEILESDLKALSNGPAALSHADRQIGQPGQKIRNVIRRNIWRRIEVGEG